VLSSPYGVDPSALFSRFDLAARRTVLVAVSGGSDSTALLILLKEHLERASPATRLVAATVDHGLRPAARAEAGEVARLCANRGIPHRILTWTAPKPASGLLAAAREARHELLAAAADSERTDLVLTGHTADDQAETVLMRQSREGGRGLAGMAPATLFCGRTWFARPFLPLRRDMLRHELARRAVTWIDDPSNEDDFHERPRIRKRLRAPGGEAAIAAALARNAEATQERVASGCRAERLIRDHARRVAAGLIRLDPNFPVHRDAAYALRILLAVVGGAGHLADMRRGQALAERLAAGTAFRAVLSRSLIDARGTGIFLLREARSLPDSTPVEDGMIWDGRYRITGAGTGFRIEPLGSRDAASCDLRDLRDAPASLVRAALAAEPHLSADGIGMPAVPSQVSVAGLAAGLPRLTPVLAPWLRYLPSFDLAPARAAAWLVGAPEIPHPPFRGHNGRDA
jgi:tRNA(Ile)-lysidine synthase